MAGTEWGADAAVRPVGPHTERAQPVRRLARVLPLWVLILLLCAPGPARANDPLMTVTKSTLLGGVTGLILGATLTLVVDNDSEVIRWGVVIGTFGGFGFGVYQAARGEGDLFGGLDRYDVTPRGVTGEGARIAAWREMARYRTTDRDRALPRTSDARSSGPALRLPVLRVVW